MWHPGADRPNGYAVNFTEEQGVALGWGDAVAVSRRPSFVSAAFAVSVAELPALGEAGLAVVPELAFVGRSNAGKSTAINVLTERRRLAFASKTPGRTQLLNFFSVLDNAPAAERTICAYLVDLPGYGFAKADAGTRARWDGLAGGYLRSRRMLRGVVLVMDARRPCLPADENLVAWICTRENLEHFRLHLLLTKSDQIGKNARRAAMQRAQRWAQGLPLATSVQLFSALDGSGGQELRDVAAQILRP